MGPPLGIEHDQKVILSVGKTLVPNSSSLTWSHWETCCTTTLYNVIVHLSSKDQLKWHIFRQPPSPLERTLSSADVGWPCIISSFTGWILSQTCFGWQILDELFGFDYLDRKLCIISSFIGWILNSNFFRTHSIVHFRGWHIWMNCFALTIWMEKIS